MQKKDTSILNNQSKSEAKKLEDYMSQVMRQNGMQFWELDMTGRRMEGMNVFGGKSLAGVSKKDIENVPEALFDQAVILEEDWEKCQEMFKKLYSGEEHTRVQCRTWSNKVQDYVWYEYNFSIIEKKNGVPVRAIVTSRDISYQKRIEQIYEEEQKILLTADDSLISFSRVNITQNRVERLLARGKDIVFENTSDVLDFRKRAKYYFDDILMSDQDNYELSIEGLHELYKSGVQEIEKYYIARRKSEQRYSCIRVNGRILEHPGSGDVIAFFYNRDNTLAYTNRLTTKSILERDYETAGVIYANTGQYRIITEVEGHLLEDNLPVVDYNAELTNFYGCMEKKAADRLMEMACFERVCQELQEKPQYSVEFDMKKNGVTRRKLLRFNYLSSTMHLILATRIDINDMVQRELDKQHQLAEALNEAEKANNAKTEFLTTVSHEVRTPMNVIMGMVQLAKEESDNHDAVMEYIDEIGISGRYLLNLLNNVLDMSKIESGEFYLHPQRYSFDDLKKNAMALFTPMCDRKQIHFEVRDFAEHKLIVDKMRIHQVVFNLLNNAVKYTDIGGEIQLIYRTKLCGENVRAEIIVKDNGIGMSKEFQQEMYKPFVQENNQVVAAEQGTGLGLSIVKGIIDKMNGELTVKSELGKGTEFCIRITGPRGDEKDSPSKKEASHGDIDFTGKTILVAEDHEMNQRIIKKLLENRGAEVIIANNGKAAVDYFTAGKENSIDVILMDVRMPVMDGLHAARMIRHLKREDAKTVPIIAMTADAYDEDREKSNAAGMNGHFSKPIDTELLYETLHTIFEGRGTKVKDFCKNNTTVT